MTQRLAQLSFLLLIGGLVVAGLVVPQGGTPTLTFRITDSGISSKLTGPTQHVRGGLVNVELINTGRMVHSAQLIRVRGKKHTPALALKTLSSLASSHSKKIPVWLRFLGGLGPTQPGQKNLSTVNLTAGQYLVADIAAGHPGLTPASTTLTVDPGNPGSLPKATATVTGATGPTGATGAAGAQAKYQWKVAGLKSGANRILFDSEGKDAIHQLVAVRLKGSPTTAELQKGLQSATTPSFVDTSVPQVGTAWLDGAPLTHTETATVDLAAGTYVLFCPLTDRHDGKPHFLEGMLTTVAVH